MKKNAKILILIFVQFMIKFEVNQFELTLILKWLIFNFQRKKFKKYFTFLQGNRKFFIDSKEIGTIGQISQ